MKWIKKEVPPEIIKHISAKYEINETLAQVLLNRGLDEDKINMVINNINEAIIDPLLLTNASLAAEIIYTYLTDEKASIIIRADYDVDGITSGYILGEPLKELGQCEVTVSYPERSEGYGLQEAFCKQVIEYKKANNIERLLVVTVDNGVTAVDEVDMLVKAGIEVIITDHHLPKEQIPNCVIVDPFLDEEDTFRHLAGCGVAFKVAQLVARLFEQEELMNQFLAPLAIGTISDMMPMSLENIAFSIYGLDQMNSDNCPLGLQALREYLGKESFSFSDIGWEIGPRINACGRMGNITLASKIFFNEELSYDEIMDDVIIEIEKLNNDRKELTDAKTKEAFTHVSEDDHVQLAILTDCKEGIAGIVANQIIQRYQRPIIVLVKSEGCYVGSARSTSAISMQDILKAEFEKGHVVAYGGHEGAAGLTVAFNQINAFRESIATYKFDGIETADHTSEQELVIDGTLEIKDLDMDLLSVLNSIPYDRDTFTPPVFEFIVNVDQKNTIPTKKNIDNLWLAVKDKTGYKKVWAKGLTSKYATLTNKDKIRVAASLKSDFMNSNKTVTMEILDIKEF